MDEGIKSTPRALLLNTYFVAFLILRVNGAKSNNMPAKAIAQLVSARFDLGIKLLNHTKNKLQSFIKLFIRNGQRRCYT